MLNSFINLFASPIFEGDGEKTKIAKPMHTILLLQFAIPAYMLIDGITTPADAPVFIPVSIIVFAGLLAMLYFLHRGRTQLVGISISALIFGVIALAFYFSGNVLRPGLMLIAIGIMTSWLFLGNRGAWYGAAFSSLLIAATLYAESLGLLQTQLSVPGRLGIWVALTITVIIIASILQLAKNNADSLLENARATEALSHQRYENNENSLGFTKNLLSEQEAEYAKVFAQSQRRAKQIETLSEISQITNSPASLDIILNSITQSTSTRLGHYHIGVYILSDDGVFAVLRSSNSEGGKRLIANGHKLRVGSEGMVGYVASQAKTRLAVDIKQDEYFMDAQELSKTQSEFTLPLKVGNKLIGVLDIEDEAPNAFISDDMEIYNVLANQIANVIETSRLRELAKRALDESETLTREYMTNSWRNYKKKTRTRGYFYSNKEFKTLAESRKLESLSGNSAETTSVPIQLRGVTIGHLNIQPAISNRKWTDNEMTIIESTASRLALALENARLVTESQRRAIKERLIGEISTRISSGTSINNIMQTAITEIGKALPGAEIAVNIKPEDASSSKGSER